MMIIQGENVRQSKSRWKAGVSTKKFDTVGMPISNG